MNSFLVGGDPSLFDCALLYLYPLSEKQKFNFSLLASLAKR